MVRVIVAVLVIGGATALAVPVFANSASPPSTDRRVAALEQHVKVLEKSDRVLRAGARAQAGINKAQFGLSRLDGRRLDITNQRIDNALDQIAALQSPEPDISIISGAPVLLSPRSAGTALAFCPSGKVVGGGFRSTSSVETSGSYPDGTGTGWTAWAANPYTAGPPATFQAYVVCLN